MRPLTDHISLHLSRKDESSLINISAMLEDKKVSGNNRKDGVKDKWSPEIILEVSTRVYSQIWTWENIYKS